MNPDYEVFDPIDGSGRFLLCRGRRLRTGAPVLIRRAATPSALDDEVLRREAQWLEALPGADLLLPRLVDNPAPALLVMEDPGGMGLAQRLADGPLSLDTAFAFALPLAASLVELHARGLVALALRPQAVWCSDQGAWLIDLSEATAPPQRTPPVPTDLHRLIYIAPEQTGRLERTPDARSDLYSFGVMLYEMLSGTPPHRGADALAQIHAHLAGVPVPLVDRVPGLPSMLSQFVARLLAKAPEERYQSAAGVLQDLTTCAREWAAHRRIGSFPLGRSDLGRQLAIPERLYGRKHELETLLHHFERARAGRASRSMVLVEGWAGIGKTALIQQLVRPIVRARGFFVAGKFDQVARGVPHSALIAAMRSLMRQLLGESEAELACWRERLLQALGANAGVLAEVIPEIVFVLGAQEPPAPLGSVEAQNRFQRVLRQFVAVLARPDQPLVLFLDDLQWADPATLALLEPLLASDIGSLMLMGAYRDQELASAPQLTRTLAGLEAAGISLTRIALGPLGADALTELVADTLHVSRPEAAPLAELIHAKTGGNPFFVTQFLRSLERDGQLRFDAAAGRWVYRIEAIAREPHADNVIELTTRNIRRLPPSAQYTLTLAACMGHRFDAATLSMVGKQTAAATEADLALASAEGLIVGPGGDDGGYVFLHDRVQQAAYGLIPTERRSRVHLDMGRLLRERSSPAQLEARLFEIAHHFELGREGMHERAECLGVAMLHLAAGRRAKAATAHERARELFEAGIALLGDDGWRDDPALAWDLHLEAAESLYLGARFDAAQQAIDVLAARARTPLDRAQALRLRCVADENMGRYADALTVAAEALQPFGIIPPQGEEAEREALDAQMEAIARLRGGREIASLIDLPALADPSVGMVMNLLTDVWSAAYIVGRGTLARWISATLVRLSLEHGLCGESAYGCVTHAINVGPGRGDYADADAFGRLALAINTRFDDRRRRAKILQQFHAHVHLWCAPYARCVAYAREASRAGLDNGDFLYAAYGAGTESWAAMAGARDLRQFVRELTPNIAVIEQLRNPAFADSVRSLIAWAQALMGRSRAPTSLHSAEFDEAAWLERYGAHPFFAAIHAVATLQLQVLMGNPADALREARRGAPMVVHLPGTQWPVLHAFWSALAAADALGADARDEVTAAHALHAQLADHCAENFRAQALLLASELARIDGRVRDALEYLEAAIEFASGHGDVALEALAHERASRLRGEGGQLHLAALHRTQAAAAYARWGAWAKARALGAAPPDANAPSGAAAAAHASPSADGGEGFDLTSVLKAAQAIAAEVAPEALRTRLLHIAIENAGAERGALVLETEAGPQVHGLDPADDQAGPAEPLDTTTRLPSSLVHYVRRTGEPLRLDGDDADDQHGDDSYIARHRPRSLLVLPLRRLGRAIGVLYLEHRGVAGVFTEARLRSVGILAAQAAISLENAALVEGLRIENAERRTAQGQLQAALAEVERLRDDLEAENSYLRRDLIANVSHDLRTPLVSMRGYLELLVSRADELPAAERRQYLGVALRQTDSLARLIDELFELARLDFKGATLRREPFALDELAADVLQKFKLAAENRGIRLALDAPTPLPQVDADIGLIERVFDNLIGNALRHTPQGGRIRISLRGETDRVVVEVCDDGEGIAPEDLPRVFDRFRRGRDGRHDASGAGLGLAITRRILELHGSEIGVESRLGAGSRFSFAVARAMPAAAPADAPVTSSH